MSQLPFADHDMLLVESAFDVISYHKLDGSVIYVSPVCRELLGYEPEELIGRPGPDPLHPDDVGVLSEAIERMMADQRDCRTEYRLRHKQGHYIWVETTNRLLNDPDNGEPRLVCVTRDITARKEVERSAREFKELVDSATRGADLGFWKHDLRDQTLVADANVAAGLDIPPEGMPTTFDGWVALVHPDDQPWMRRMHQEYASGEREDHEYEIRLKTAGGGWKWVLSRGRVVQRDTDGRPLRVAGTHLDITSRHKVEDELAEAKRAAEAANQAKSRFLANVSHEIRTPMTAILGYTDWLLSLTQEDTRQRHALEVIHRHANALLVLINDVLDLSKIEAEKLEPALVECSPWQVAVEAAELLKMRADEKGLHLKLDFHPPLPRRIRTDATRVRQVLVNLLGNAIKFSSEGEVRLTVAMQPPRDQCRPGEPQLVAFTVSDEGVGMSRDEIARLFQPFEQVDSSARRRFGGTGLGLAISRRLADLLGGGISVESEPGQGSRFTFTIDPGDLTDVPWDLFYPPRDEPEASSKDKGAAVPATLDGRILLAEDGRDVRLMLRRLLEKVGLEVDTAENGRVAVQKAIASQQAGRPYDLILMDVQMPELDGNEAMRQLRHYGWTKPILAITAHAMAGDAESFRSAGYDDHVPKPVRYESLVSTLTRHLGPLDAENEEPAKGNAPSDTADGGTSLSAVTRGPSGPPSGSQPLGFAYLSSEELGELMAQFAAELPGRAQRLDEALKAGDCGELGNVAHQLKGAAAMHGFDQIRAAAEEICQEAGQTQSTDQLGAKVHRLIELCQAIANQYVAG